MYIAGFGTGIIAGFGLLLFILILWNQEKISTYDSMGIAFVFGVISGYMICAAVVYFTILERLKIIEKNIKLKNNDIDDEHKRRNQKIKTEN